MPEPRRCPRARFAQPLQRKPLWRIPIVSSFLLATGGLLLAHYLSGRMLS